MQTKLIVGLALLLLAFGSGWIVSGWHQKSGYAKTLQAALEQQKENIQAASDAAIALEKTRKVTEIQAREITKRVEVYLEKVPPSECFDAEALKIFNEVS